MKKWEGLTMMDNKFEQAFGDYVDSMEYEEICNELFAMTRNAFLAGWRAAGGSLPTPGHVFRIWKQDDR